MVGRHVADKDRPLLEQRQMATAQLLVQLLPRDNATLLRALLVLLHQVATTEGNLMTAETLGTMFAPHLLVPRRVSGVCVKNGQTNTSGLMEGERNNKRKYESNSYTCTVLVVPVQKLQHCIPPPPTNLEIFLIKGLNFNQKVFKKKLWIDVIVCR